MELQLFNTLGRSKQIFTPLDGKNVRIYSCGPTVYASPHVGNFRAFIFADILRRTLEFAGYDVVSVINITDVGHLTTDGNEGEDKLEKGAKKTGKTVWEVAKFYEEEFLAAIDELNIRRPTHLPRATDHIAEQIELIERLTKKGVTYETSDGIYFDVAKFENYGKLSGQSLDEKEAGARVEVRDEKRNAADFALWKFCVDENADHAMRWPNPPSVRDGEGFPGWHIECSAMGMKYLGETFDIHTGGVDHIPVHHENEIAQSEAATDNPLANFWLHNEFLTVDGGKMSKSLGNLFTLADLKEKGFEPLAFRYLSLGTHFRKKLDFSWPALEAAATALTKLRKIFQSLPAPSEGEPLEKFVDEFGDALADDLNTPQALAVVWEVAKNETISPAVKSATLAKFDEVLGLDLARVEKSVELTDEQQTLLDERKVARDARDFETSDRIRDEFAAMNLEIEDTPDGQIVHKK